MATERHLNVEYFPQGHQVTGQADIGYAIDPQRASYGPAELNGPCLVWTVTEQPVSGALLTAPIALDEDTQWLLRCDRVDFPPGGIAYRHTHPGPGIRVLVQGQLTVEAEGHTATHTPIGAWFESGPEPVLATASTTEDSAFVRVMAVPAHLAGQRTITYVDPADADRPKRQQATIYFERPMPG